MKKKTVKPQKKTVAKKAAPAKKTATKKVAAKKAAPAKKTATKKVAAKKAAPAKKTATKKVAAKKAAPAKKTAAKKVVAKKAAPAKKTAAKKVVAKKAAPTKKTAAKKVVAKKAAPAKKTAAKKVVAKKAVKVEIKSLKNEEWKKVRMPHPTKKCDYYISNRGRLKSKNKSTKSEYLLKGSPMRTGYLQLNVKLEGEHRANYYVHKLVAQYFIPNKAKKTHTMVIHVNGDKKDNKAKNLKWVDKAGLAVHHEKLGTYKYERGTRALPSHVVMNETKVKQLKRALKAGKLTRTKLSEKFNITMTQIKRIERGENWGHVTID